MAAPSGGTPRRTTSREWTGLATPAGFERCVSGTLRELYGYVALLAGRDRREAEELSGDVYRSLFGAARAGHVDGVTLGSLRSAARRMWLDAHLHELVTADEVSREPASTIADLSTIERVVLVFRHVNGMSVQRTAMEIGRTEREVMALDAHSVRRLRGTDDTSGAWLRAYLGPTVTPAGGLVDRIVRQLGARPEPAADASTAEHGSSVDEATQPIEVVSPDDLPTRPVDVSPVSSVDDDVPPEAVATTELPIVERPTVEVPAIAPTRPADPPADPPVAGSSELLPSEIRPNEVPGADGESASVDEVSRATLVLPAEGDAGSPTSLERRRPTWLLLAGAVLVAALVAALVWLAVRGDGEETLDSAPASGRTSDDATDTTVAAADDTATTLTDESDETSTEDSAGEPTSSDPVVETTLPTPVAPPTSTATAIAGERSSQYEPACDARIGDADPTPLLVPSGPFGSLAAEPAVAVAIPRVRAETGTMTDPAISVVRAGDGVLVLLEALPDISDVTDRVVAYVGLDGTLAWVRCLTDDATVLVEPTAAVPLALGLPTDPADPEGGTTWYPFDLDDGALGDPYDGITERAINASLRLAGSVSLAEPVVTWQYADGRWVLTGLDADGGVAWADPAAEAPYGDNASFVIHQSDGVAVVATCAERPGDDPENCVEPGPLVGYDVATGDVLWSVEGDLAPVVADGFALVRSDAGWDLVDVADGSPVDGQHWDDPATFEQSAGLEIESIWVDWRDGVLVAAHGDRVDLWLPEAFESPTVDVSIG